MKLSTAAPSWLIVGLGNPGTKYAATRHNIGFMVVDELARHHKAEWKEPSSLWQEASYRHAGQSVLLVKPLTYMNDSGRAVKRLLGLHHLRPDRVVAIVDEYNFPTGRIHLRSSGSDGGHNGLTSLITELGTPSFWRLRCGIDRKFGPGGLVDYVLGAFPADEDVALRAMITNAVKAVDDIVRIGAERAMQGVNTQESPIP